jgi:hypothetical protein
MYQKYSRIMKFTFFISYQVQRPGALMIENSKSPRQDNDYLSAHHSPNIPGYEVIAAMKLGI